MNKQGDKTECLLYKLPGAKVTDYIEPNVGARMVCSSCGEYIIIHDVFYKLGNDEAKLAKLANLARTMKEANQLPLEITGENIEDLLSKAETIRES